MTKHVLCLVTDGFEEIEMVTPVDLLRRAEIKVVIASLNGGVVTGRCGIRIEPDVSLDEVNADGFEVLFIPGGPGVKQLRADGRAASLARKFQEAGKIIAAICAAPLVLHDAGILAGKRFTAHSSTYDELTEAIDERVVEDGWLVTSRGAGTALDFGMALVRKLEGDQTADEVAKAIMA